MAQTTVKENKMGTASIGKLLMAMSTPMMLSMLVQALYNIVDSIFVSRICEDALTAVSLAFPVQNLMISFAIGTGVGMGALVSRHLGEKDFDRANSVAINGIYLFLFTAIVFAVLVTALSDTFFRLMTDNEVIRDYGITYTKIIGMLCFGMYFQVCFERLLISTGKTTYSMITQMTGAITNIIMDPLLIFGIGPFPELGIAGAAYATIFGQTLGTVLAIIFNFRVNKELHISFVKYHLSGEIIKSIYSIGVPSIIMAAIGSVMNFGLNKILLVFSSTAAAVFGVYFKLQSFVFMPVFGLNNGMVPIVAYNYGAAKPDRIKRTIKLATIAAVVIMALGTVVFNIFPAELLRLFDASETMTEMGVIALRIISVHFVIAGFSIICTSTFQALGHGFYSMIISVLRQMAVLLPAAYILAGLGGLNAVWWSFPIAELFAAVMCLIIMRKIMREQVDPLYQRG